MKNEFDHLFDVINETSENIKDLVHLTVPLTYGALLEHMLEAKRRYQTINEIADTADTAYEDITNIDYSSKAKEYAIGTKLKYNNIKCIVAKYDNDNLNTILSQCNGCILYSTSCSHIRCTRDARSDNSRVIIKPIS